MLMHRCVCVCGCVHACECMCVVGTNVDKMFVMLAWLAQQR